MSALAESAAADLEERLRKELRIVMDPEIGRSVIDIGLIYKVDVLPRDHVVIDMTTTTKGCPATGFLVEAVRACIQESGLVRSVEVRLTYDPPWTPDMMRD